MSVVTNTVWRSENEPVKYPRRHSLLCLILFSVIAFTSGACGRKAKVATPKAVVPPPPVAQTKPLPRPPETPIQPAPLPAEPQPAPPPPVVFEPSSAPTLAAPGPQIRIGLSTAAHEVRISSTGEFSFTAKVPEAEKQVVRGELHVRVERGEENRVEIFRVQVASLSRRDSAEELARKLKSAFSSPAVVRENPEKGLFQVRLGSFRNREKAKEFAAGPLAKAGYARTMIVHEEAPLESHKLRLAIRGKDVFNVSGAGFLFQPATAGAFLRLDGKPYRGNLDLTLNRNGTITIVNQLGTEEYLLGVVPAELSPTVYPEPAALEAQSIAARTYALKNVGRFAADGFDLTADVRTQVYGGVAQERDGATKAVIETYGLAIYYQDKLIDAMYSSTCGGRTEDFANVFDSAPVPYLRGVVCEIESGSGNALDSTIQGTHPLDQVLYAEDGAPINRNLELGQVLGLTGQEELSSLSVSMPALAAEIRAWTGNALKAAGKATKADPSEKELTTRAGFVRYAVERLLGTAEMDLRITERDANYFLGNVKDGDQVPTAARRAVALVLQTGLLRTYPDNSFRPGNPIKRSEVLYLLSRWVESNAPEVLRSGLFDGSHANPGEVEGGSPFVVKWGNKNQQFPLAGRLRLFKSSQGRAIPVDSLKLIGNEKLRFHVASDGAIDFLEAELNPTGAATDRFSPVATWTTTLQRSVLSEKLRSLTGDIGEIRDIRPSRLGTSGRAVQIQIVGSRRSITLNGYRVRNALGLKDTLFTIQRTKDPAGTVESFTFNGRGWGHGVGLCQVGAYGMARAGRSYEEILKTYYQGVELRKAY